MSRIAARAGALTLALTLLGGGAAQAWSWGVLSVSDGGYTQGQGYGEFRAVSNGGAQLHNVYLRDLRADGGRTYAEGRGYGNNDYVKVQSGRRSDNGSSWGLMQDKTGYSASSSTVGWSSNVKICQDKSGHPDPCSGTQSGRL